MKKAFKMLALLLAVVAAFIAILCGVVYLLVARKAGLRLPAYEISVSDDNMDRMASAWSCYSYEIAFRDPLPESFLRSVKRKKTCVRDGDMLVIEDGVSDSWSCRIRLFPAEKRAVLEYTFWDFLF